MSKFPKREILCVLKRDPIFGELYRLQLERMLGGELLDEGIMRLTQIPPVDSMQWIIGLRYMLERLASAPSPEALCVELDTLKLSAPPFVIEYHRIGRHPLRIPSRTLLGQLALRLEGEISFSNPQRRFLLIETERAYHLAMILPIPKRVYQDFSRRPHPYSAALSTELAGLSVNLVASTGDRLLDPTCGSGTVVYEALCRGVHARGADVKWQWVTRARENLSAFGYDQNSLNLGAELLIRRDDASHLRDHVDAIVANLPYNRRVLASEGSLLSILRNLKCSADRFVYFSGRSIETWLEDLGYDNVTSVDLTTNPSHPRYISIAESTRKPLMRSS